MTLAAENELLRTGIEQQRRGDFAAAFATWQQYRNRFPDGALRFEVDLAALETALQHGSRQRALAEATGILDRYAGSDAIAEVHAIRGTLFARGHQCREALIDFDRSGSATTLAPGRREEVMYGRGACLAEIRSCVQGAESLTAYLQTHPHGRFVAAARAALEILKQSCRTDHSVTKGRP